MQFVRCFKNISHVNVHHPHVRWIDVVITYSHHLLRQTDMMPVEEPRLNLVCVVRMVCAGVAEPYHKHVSCAWSVMLTPLTFPGHPALWLTLT